MGKSIVSFNICNTSTANDINYLDSVSYDAHNSTPPRLTFNSHGEKSLIRYAQQT